MGLFFRMALIRILFFVIGFTIGKFYSDGNGGTSTTGDILSVVLTIVEIVINLGFLGIYFNLYKKEKTGLNKIFSNYKLFFKAFFGALLYTLIVIGGILLLIVPGVIWGIKYRYFIYLIVDENLGPIQALKKSAKITQGAKLDLYIFGLVRYLIFIFSLLTFGVGFFFTIPLIYMSEIFIYHKLKASHK